MQKFMRNEIAKASLLLLASPLTENQITIPQKIGSFLKMKSALAMSNYFGMINSRKKQAPQSTFRVSVLAMASAAIKAL